MFRRKRRLANNCAKHESMFESALLPDIHRRNPRITSHDTVNESLVKDRLAFVKKYGKESGQPHELARDGSYATILPHLGQHKKFTLEAALERKQAFELECDDDEDGICEIETLQKCIFVDGMDVDAITKVLSEKPISRASVMKSETSITKFNLSTLEELFRELGPDIQGRITQSAFVRTLLSRKDLQLLFASSFFKASVSTNNKAKKELIMKLTKVMHESDTDGDGGMDWLEFVEFFKRFGLLLTYETRKTLNDTTPRTSANLLKALSADPKQAPSPSTPKADSLNPRGALQGIGTSIIVRSFGLSDP